MEKVFDANVIYLRDEAGEVYAEVHGPLADAPPTKVRLRKGGGGREYKVAKVETATNMVRLKETDREGQEQRTKWRSVDDLEVVGAIMSPEAALQERARLEARLKELDATKPPPAPEAPPDPEVSDAAKHSRAPSAKGAR